MNRSEYLDSILGKALNGQLGALDKADHENDGSWYAITPDENSDDEYKFPIDNCSDVDDAWDMAGHGDYSVSESTLQSRIQDRANELDCDNPDDDGDGE